MRATIADRPRLEATRRDSRFAFPDLSYDVLPNGRDSLMLKGTRGGELVTLITNWPQLLTPARAAQSASVP